MNRIIKIVGEDIYISSPAMVKKNGVYVPNYTGNKHLAAVYGSEAELQQTLDILPLLPRILEFVDLKK